MKIVTKLRQLIHRIGHRGAFLAFLALLDILYGYSLLVQPGPTNHISYIFPLNVWAYIWLLAGIILVTGIPAKHDRVHFGIAASVKALWAAAWADVWFFEHYPRAWVNFVLWAAFAALVVVVSSWPEMRRHNCSGRGEKSDE